MTFSPVARKTGICLPYLTLGLWGSHSSEMEEELGGGSPHKENLGLEKGFCNCFWILFVDSKPEVWEAITDLGIIWHWWPGWLWVHLGLLNEFQDMTSPSEKAYARSWHMWKIRKIQILALNGPEFSCLMMNSIWRIVSALPSLVKQRRMSSIP